jgi:transposase InsO family protein
MRQAGLKATTTGLYQWKKGHQEFYAAQGNLLKEQPEAIKTNQHWAGDFTYLKSRSGWLYFAVVLDLYTRKVIGWSFNSKRTAELTRSALRMAAIKTKPKKGCYFHSDQGIEYMAHSFQKDLDNLNMIRSVSRKACPTDNAFVESFFHTMKAELGRPKFEDKVEAVTTIVEYVEFYNRERLHSSLNYQSPLEYEKLSA